MNKLLLFTMLLNTGCALAQPASTKFTIRVMDGETGVPITNAIVHTGFTLKADPWGTGRGKSIRVEKTVDEKGMVTFTGDTVRDERGGNVFPDGYYSSRFGMKYNKNLALNRWEPWNPSIEVKMRKKKNPVTMVYKRMLRKKIPVSNDSFGYDLEIGDWVAPYGNGKTADFLFSVTNVIEPKKGIRYTLSFSNPLDGIQEFPTPENLRSSFIFPYEAPTNGYASSFGRYRLLVYPVIKDYPANNLKDDKATNYIFRTRTKVDEDGNIVSANYGRIKGEVTIFMNNTIDLQYWFNPNPQNRSLESNKRPY